jgi:hypothetical protein
MNSFQFKCTSCNYGVILGDVDSWVDECGNFGYSMHPGREAIGNPQGRFEFFFCTMVLCLGCTREFNILRKPSIDHYYGPQFSVQYRNRAPPPLKEERLVLVANFVELPDSFNPSRTVPHVALSCPECGDYLHTKDELLLHVKGRERASYQHYPPIEKGEDLMMCPACKAAVLEYKGMSIY